MLASLRKRTSGIRWGFVATVLAAALFCCATWAAIDASMSVAHDRRERDRRGRLDEIVIAENFDSLAPGTLPPGWRQVDLDSGFCGQFGRASTWQVYEYGRSLAHSVPNVVMCHFNSDQRLNNDWLILPAQTLSGTITLSYWVASQDNFYRDSYEVRVSTVSDDPAEFANLIDSTRGVPTSWMYQAHDLSRFAGQPFWIAFRMISNAGFVLKIDDVQLEARGTGAITGLVRNARNDTLIGGSIVELLEEELIYATPESGAARARYVFSGLYPGSYSLRASHPNFYPRLLSNVTVVANQTTPQDVRLDPRPLASYNFASTARGDSIFDFDTARISLTIDTVLIGGVWRDTNLVIYDLDVTMNLVHSYVGDLDLWLKAPSGERVQVIVHDVQRAGDNLANCRFDDEAVEAFAEGAAPYTGRWQPLQSLSRMDGETIQGTWTMEAYDNYARDIGQLSSFTLHVTTELATSTAGERTPFRSFRFDGGYPNPFNHETWFRFELAHRETVRLSVFDLQGRRVRELVHHALEAGSHTVRFDATSLPSGCYFAHLSAGANSKTVKILLLK